VRNPALFFKLLYSKFDVLCPSSCFVSYSFLHLVCCKECHWLTCGLHLVKECVSFCTLMFPPFSWLWSSWRLNCLSRGLMHHVSAEYQCYIYIAQSKVHWVVTHSEAILKIKEWIYGFPFILPFIPPRNEILRHPVSNSSNQTSLLHLPHYLQPPWD